MSGDPSGFDADPLDRVEHDQREDDRRELAVAGGFQLVGVCVQQEVGYVAAGRLGRLLDELPGRVIDPWLAHSGLLRSLAGEGEDDHRISEGTFPGVAGRRDDPSIGPSPSDSRSAREVSRISIFAAEPGKSARESVNAV